MGNASTFLKFLSTWLACQYAVLLAATAVALVAVATGTQGTAVAIGWCVVVLATTFRTRTVALSEPAEPEPVIITPEPVDPLPFIWATLSAIDAPVLVLGPGAEVLYQNNASIKALGLLPAGAHISARLRSPGILDMVRETIATNEPNQIEHSERLPSERVYIVRIAPFKAPLLPSAFGPLYVLAFRDISELRRIDRMRSDFVANASHELRTPLASLRGFIETMQGPARNDPAAQERFLGIMLDQATRMSRLVDDLLSLSRLELKSHLAPDQTVDLVPVIGHVRDSLMPLATELGLDINIHAPEGRVEVLGDRDELVQVFENLVENACKYGEDGKAIDIYLRNRTGQPVEVSVIDQGPGIPPEHVPRLTERFYRVSVADSRSKKGTGLGLAIVKHILTRHRARLIVKSDMGKGTDFTVRF